MSDRRGYKRIRTEEIVIDEQFHHQEQYYQMSGNNIFNSNNNHGNVFYQQPVAYKRSQLGCEPVITEPEDIVQLENTSYIVEVHDDFDIDVESSDDFHNNFVSPEKFNEDDFHSRKGTRPFHDHDKANNQNIDKLNNKIIELTIEINKILMALH